MHCNIAQWRHIDSGPKAKPSLEEQAEGRPLNANPTLADFEKHWHYANPGGQLLPLLSADLAAAALGLPLQYYLLLVAAGFSSTDAATTYSTTHILMTDHLTSCTMASTCAIHCSCLVSLLLALLIHATTRSNCCCLLLLPLAPTAAIRTLRLMTYRSYSQG